MKHHQDPRIVVAYFKANGLPEPEAEVMLIPGRRFRWDWILRNEKIGIEIQGGLWSGGAHGRGWGIKRDMEKSNLAASLGWLTLSFEPKSFLTVESMDLIRKAIESRNL